MKTNKLTFGLLTGMIACTGLATTAYGAQDIKGNLSEELRDEMRSIIISGDYDEYVTFATENDLRVMDAERFDKKTDRAQTREQSQEAALDGDYTEWRSIVGDEKMTDINADNFYLITDLAQAQESEDADAKAAAKQALKDAGIERPTKEKNNRGNRDGERGERGGFSDRFGVERNQVEDLSDDEKQDLLESIIEQIKTRLGLS